MFILYNGNKSSTLLFMIPHNSCMGALSVGVTIKTQLSGFQSTYVTDNIMF